MFRLWLFIVQYPCTFRLFTKIASESDVFDEFKSMSLLLLKCRDLLNNTENKNQESIPKPYDVKQKYFEEFIKLIEEYKLASGILPY